MRSVFATYDDAVSCRSCGATHAKPHDNQWKLCASCFSAVEYRQRKLGLTDDAVTMFLAQRLLSDLKRAGRGKFLGRCEVISNSAAGFKGYQCAHLAADICEGRKVCESHLLTKYRTYVGEATLDEYSLFAINLQKVCQKDKRFAAAVRAAIEGLAT